MQLLHATRCNNCMSESLQLFSVLRALTAHETTALISDKRLNRSD